MLFGGVCCSAQTTLAVRQLDSTVALSYTGGMADVELRGLPSGKVVINLDLDGVLYPFFPTVFRAPNIVKYFGDHFDNYLRFANKSEWDVPRAMGWDSEIFWELVDEDLNDPDGYLYNQRTLPLRYFNIGLDLKDKVYVRIITQKSLDVDRDILVPKIEGWLHKHKVSYDTVAVVSHSSSKPLYKADIAIDDHPELEWCINGEGLPYIPNYLILAPYNRHHEASRVDVRPIEELTNKRLWATVRKVWDLKNDQWIGDAKAPSEVPTETSFEQADHVLNILGIDTDSPVRESAKLVLRAIQLVGGERGQAYGHPLDDYTRTAEIFRAMTGRFLTAKEAATFMMAVKMSREQNAHRDDNVIDLVGYILCVDMIRRKLEEEDG